MNEGHKHTYELTWTNFFFTLLVVMEGKYRTYSPNYIFRAD